MDIVDKLLELYGKTSRQHWLTAAAVLSGLLLVKHVVRAHRMLAQVNYTPGYRFILRPNPLLSLLKLPRIPFIFPGWGWGYRDKHQMYETCNSDIITTFGLFPSPGLGIAIADAAVAKEIATNRTLFTKPIGMYRAIAIYGTNVVTSESEEWKLHRRITAPSFNERNNRLVFEESTKIISDLFALWERKHGGGIVTVDDIGELTTQFALMVIAAAGFDVHYAWEDTDTNVKQGFEFTLPNSLRTVMSNIIIRIAFSDRLLGLSKKGKNTKVAFRDFKAHMINLIEERKNIPQEERRADLLSNLLEGTAEETTSIRDDPTLHFGDEELLGNIFIFLFAGHETTAHTLAFAVALIAAHAEIQEKLYTSIRELVPRGEAPTYAAIVKWSYGLSVIYETLRLYPPVVSIPKQATQDTVVTTHSTDGNETPILVPIPKGVPIMLSIVGLHYNPKYWDKPHAFRPERFLGEYNRDAFFPFAAGPRACMGRRFSEIEALTLLANLVLNYKFSGTKLHTSETPEQVAARVLGWRMGPITLHPAKASFTFIKRES